MGGMFPWATRNRLYNGSMEMIDDRKTDTKGVVTNLRNTVLMHQLCGEDCRKCEVKCNYGIEALRRGLDVLEKQHKQLKRGRRKLLPEVFERPECHYNVEELSERWGVSITTMEHWFQQSGAKATCRYNMGGRKIYSLYDERKLMDMLMAFTSDGKHEIIRGRLLKVKRRLEL